VAARDALLLVERTAQSLTGGADLPVLTQTLINIHTIVISELQDQENHWANTLQAINKGALDDQEEEQEK
jgi:hypothetical protein